jgi:hypothetical protein
MATAGIASSLAGLFTLWEGTVEPPRGLDGRLRLVVAEYEEYLIDERRPTTRFPSARGGDLCSWSMSNWIERNALAKAS